jgi:iron complex outermembrane recepter protein
MNSPLRWSSLPTLTIAAVLCLSGNLNGHLYAQSVFGTVFSRDSLRIPNAVVSIPSLHQSVSTEFDGSFRFSGVHHGTYLVTVQRIGYEGDSSEVVLDGDSAGVAFFLHENPTLLRPFTVTALPVSGEISNSSRAVSIVQGNQMLEAGLDAGAGLRTLAGVSTIRNGPFSEKPVIRGLSYQRILILQDGEPYEYQNWDDDDSPDIDAPGTKQVEVIRGAAGVLYGSDALGGVVNFIGNEGGSGDSIEQIHGNVIIRGFSAITGGSAHAGIGGNAAQVRYDAGFTMTGAGDVHTPAGSLANTGGSETQFNGGILTPVGQGDMHLAYSRSDQKREILAVGGDSGSTPYQTTTHDRLFLSYAGRNTPVTAVLTGVYQRNGAREYDEADAAQPQNHLLLQSLTGDGRIAIHPDGNNAMTFGLSLLREWNSTLGEEAVIPSFRQMTTALFVLEDYRPGAVNFSFGLRYTSRSLDVSANEDLGLSDQSAAFGGVTASAGITWHVTDEYSLALNSGTGWRAPDVKELYINGVQEGSLMYDSGNPGLLPERSFANDLVIRYAGPTVNGEISAYYNRINRYIYLAPTGEVDTASGFMRYVQDQANATLAGIDGEIGGMLLRRVSFTVRGGFLVARNDDAGTWLPRTSPDGISLNLKWMLPPSSWVDAPYLHAGMESVFDQGKVDPLEIETPGHVLFDAGIGGTVRICEHLMSVQLKIHNLFDRGYRDHLSMYRLYAEEPGRDVAFLLNIPF